MLQMKLQFRFKSLFSKVFFLIAVLFSAQWLDAQSALPKSVEDSLRNVFTNEDLADTLRMKAMDDLAWDGYLYSLPDSAVYYADMLYDFAEKRKDIPFMINALNTKGNAHYVQGNYTKSLEYFNSSLALLEQQNETKSNHYTSVINNIGNVHFAQGNYVKAIDCFSIAVKNNEAQGNKHGMASALNNIGVIHKNQNELEKALEYYNKAFLIFEELKSIIGMANALSNIGVILQNQQNFEESIEYHNRALKLRMESGDRSGEAGNLCNLGDIYIQLKEFELAQKHLESGLEIYRATNDKSGESQAYILLSQLQLKIGNNSKAVEYGSIAVKTGQETGTVKVVRDAAEVLSKAYKNLNDTKSALEMYELFVIMRDSLLNVENQKAVIRFEFKSGYEKQAAADSVAFAKESEIKQIEIAKQQAEIRARKNQQYGLFGGLILALVFAGFLFNRFKVTSRQKQIIEDQKTQVETKSNEVTRSIEYASRLQKAILPPISLVNKYLPNSFVFYKPRDIVAGDIYWAQKTGNTVFFAVADCTGHGVPAAMVSVVCCNALNNVVGDGFNDPGQILTKTRELVLETFMQSEQQVYEGMDISLGALSGNLLSWAGANNPLWLFRNDELIELKPDRQPVGKSDDPAPFTTHQIELQQDDMIYVFTDGFQDQFGGPNGKKYKSVNFKKLLVVASHMSAQEQCSFLEKTFNDWKGDHQQLDDVCIMGVRV
jgi:serine phosphatase RsbU (regulator of sigma subunit)